MASVLLTADNRKCRKCGAWRHIDEFPMKRRTCRECRKHEHYAYRARRNASYTRCPLVPITAGLTKALEVACEHHGSNVKEACANIGISRAAYYRVIQGPAYAESGIRTQVRLVTAENILRAAQTAIARRASQPQQWFSASEI